MNNIYCITNGKEWTLDMYRSWMCDEHNSHNCDECPENENRSSRLPCGQQNCWVDCHCRGGED